MTCKQGGILNRFALLLAIAFFAPSGTHAGGGWVSSGGELFKDAKNPWFVSNTPHVKYCVEVDAASFSATPDTAKKTLVSALNYWKSEFEKASGKENGNGTVAIGTQTFSEVDCSLGVADLLFKFGYGTLSQQEIEFLKNPKKYIGVSVRTRYDETHLKADGFVFIASDLGPNAYDNPSGALINQAWKHETLLFYALLHELGHVFGLPHTGSGLMSEVFLDQILNRAIHGVFLDSPVESFFTPEGQLESCSMSGSEKQFFGMSLEYECMSLSGQLLGGSSDVSVLGKKRGSHQYESVGVIKAIKLNYLDLRSKPAVYLQLPENQKVFSREQAAYRSFMIGASFEDFGAEAAFFPKGASPIPKPLYLRVSPSSVQLIGSSEGKIKTVFNYNSLIGTKLLIVP